MTKILNEAINLVDDDLISEAYFVPSNKKSFSVYKYMAIAAAFAIILTAVVLGTRGANKPAIEPTTHPTEQYGGMNNLEVINDSGIVFENTAYTDEEIKTFIEENKNIIAGNTAIEYQAFDIPIKIATKGYSPVCLGETNILVLDNLTLPIMIDDNIVGSVSLFKVDGKIKFTTSAHGEAWGRLTNALKENPDSELAFFYVGGYREIAVTPENKVYPLLSHVELPLDENVDYYNKFKTDYNVYSWEILNDENNYIEVVVSESDLDSEGETSDVITDNTTKVSDTVAVTDDIGRIIEIRLEDVLSKEISSIEVNSSTRLLLDQKPITVTEEQKEKILSYISDIQYTEAVDYQTMFGGSYIVKLNYDDSSSAEIVFMDKYFYIYSSDGQSVYYADETDNSVNLAYYIVDLIS